MHIRPATLCSVDCPDAFCRLLLTSRHALAGIGKFGRGSTIGRVLQGTTVPVRVRPPSIARSSAYTGFFTALLLAAAVPLVVSAQTAGRSNDGLVISSMVGRDLFQFYCASCHGRDGKGSGHVASALKVPPPDLTTLAERNKGTFPAARLEAVIKGGARLNTPAHGSTEMPVWGPIFSGLDQRGEVNAIRIENLISYIRSIQAKAKAAPVPPTGGPAPSEIQ